MCKRAKDIERVLYVHTGNGGLEHFKFGIGIHFFNFNCTCLLIFQHL